MPQIVIVTLDGCIASGKSTLVKRLRERLAYPVVVAKEPVEEWERSGLLSEMYEAIALKDESGQLPPDGMPGMFQVYAFSTRLGEFAQRYREASAMDAEVVVLLSERSVYSDRAIFKHMLKDGGYITDVQSRVYDGCFEAWENACERCRPDVSVWLDTPPMECLRRQHERGRVGEDALFEKQDTKAIKYARQLQERHVDVFGNGKFEGAEVIKLNGHTPFDIQEEEADKMAKQLDEAINRFLATPGL